MGRDKEAWPAGLNSKRQSEFENEFEFRGGQAVESRKLQQDFLGCQ